MMIRCLCLLSLSALFALPIHAADKVPADKIFPDATKGFVSIPSLKNLTTLWEQTASGKLFKDPLMDGFKKEVQKQITSRLEKGLGLTLDAVTGLPSGEVAFGMIAVPNEIPGNVLTMDVSDRRQKVAEYLADFTKKLVDIGVKKSTTEYKGQTITVLQFPPPKINEAAKVDEKAPVAAKRPDQFAYYLFKEDTLVVADQLHLIKLVADRIVDQTGKSLADVEDYQAVMKRLNDDMPQGSAEPQIRWYIEPLNYGEALRTLYTKVNPNKKEKPSIFAILKQQGIGALRGIGGYVNLKSEDKESVYRTFIYAKRPYEKAMKMFEFPNEKPTPLPSWMPADLARCTLVYVDPIKIFDNFGPLFDAVAMQGEQGVWADIVKGLEEDPNGPKINLRDELVTLLGNRVLGMSHYAKPITVNSESIVVAVELKDGKEKDMLQAMEKLFGTDPEMQGTPYKNYKLWHRIAGEAVIEPIDIEVPSLVDAAPTTARKAAPPRDEDNAPPVFPDGAVVIAKGCLIVSTNIDYLKLVLDRLDSEAEAAKSTIRDQPDYKEIDRVFAGMGLTDKPHFLQLFARTHETFRPTYEMVRQNRMPSSQAVLAKLMNMVLTPDDDTDSVRKQIIDGSSLPVFDKVEKYFGTIGIYGMTEENGFFIKGFVLPRNE